MFFSLGLERSKTSLLAEIKEFLALVNKKNEAVLFRK